MNAQTNVETIFEVDGFTFNLSTLPVANVVKLVKKSVEHKLRNEASSSALTQINAATLANKRAATNDPKAELADGEKATVKHPDYEALRAAASAENAKLILEGTIGEGRGASGPRLSDFERRCIEMSLHGHLPSKLPGVLPVLRSPKFDLFNTKEQKGKTPALKTVVTFKDGTSRVLGEMVNSYYNKNKVAIDRAVQKAIDDEAKKADVAAAQVEGEGGLDF